MEMNKEAWKLINVVKLTPAIVIAVIIVYFSSLPNPITPEQKESLEEILVLDVNSVLHICEYASFAFFVAFGLLTKMKGRYIFILTSLFALSDEIHQYFVPNRFFDVLDIMTDIFGVLLGLFAYSILKQLFTKKSNFGLNIITA